MSSGIICHSFKPKVTSQFFRGTDETYFKHHIRISIIKYKIGFCKISDLSNLERSNIPSLTTFKMISSRRLDLSNFKGGEMKAFPSKDRVCHVLKQTMILIKHINYNFVEDCWKHWSGSSQIWEVPYHAFSKKGKVYHSLTDKVFLDFLEGCPFRPTSQILRGHCQTVKWFHSKRYLSNFERALIDYLGFDFKFYYDSLKGSQFF